MFRDPTDTQERTLRGFRPEVLDMYDRDLPEIVAPPHGYQNTTAFYGEIKSARDIQEEFITETPIYESVDYAIHSNPNTSEDVVGIMQGREINSYTLDTVQTPTEVEQNGSKRHWDHLLKTIPRDSKISFAQGLAVIDFPMSCPDGINNNGTMVLDLRNGSEKDGFRIQTFLQTGENGTISPSAIFQREDIEVRFKEEFIFVRWFQRVLGRRTRATAGREDGKNRINVHELFHSSDTHEQYTDIPLFFHELSHIKDAGRTTMTKEERRMFATAYFVDKYIPLAASATGINAILGTYQPWMLLFTGGLITLDRILHKLSRDPDNDVGKAFQKIWRTETEARFSQKVAADLMVANGFAADTRSYKHILDLYQPSNWSMVDEFTREAEKELRRRNPQPLPNPAI